MARSTAPGALLVALASLVLLPPPPARACDPDHDWRPIGERAWRAPHVGLLADIVLDALKEARGGVSRLAILSVEDRYARASVELHQGEEPPLLDAAQRQGRERQLHHELEERLLGEGVGTVPTPEIERLLVDQGELARFDPTFLTELCLATGASHVLRLSLVGYTCSRVEERDLQPANENLFQDQDLYRMNVRVALLDARGELLFIDELAGQESRREMYWVRAGKDWRKPVEVMHARHAREAELWHDLDEHGGVLPPGELRVQPLVRREP